MRNKNTQNLFVQTAHCSAETATDPNSSKLPNSSQILSDMRKLQIQNQDSEKKDPQSCQNEQIHWDLQQLSQNDKNFHSSKEECEFSLQISQNSTLGLDKDHQTFNILNDQPTSSTLPTNQSNSLCSDSIMEQQLLQKNANRQSNENNTSGSRTISGQFSILNVRQEGRQNSYNITNPQKKDNSMTLDTLYSDHQKKDKHQRLISVSNHSSSSSILDKISLKKREPKSFTCQNAQEMTPLKRALASLMPEEEKSAATLSETNSFSGSKFHHRMSDIKKRLTNQSLIPISDRDDTNSMASSISESSNEDQSQSPDILRIQQKSRLRQIRKNSIKLQKEYKNQEDNRFEKKYELGNKIGQGAHSTVFKCYLRSDINRTMTYAVKVTREDDEEKKISIENEYKILSELRHPNLVQALDYFENKLSGEIHIVMTYFQGQDLYQKQKQGSLIEEKEANSIMRQVLDGIDYLHIHNIVHRDIKPDNVIITDFDEVRIIDFNVSRKFHKSQKMMTRTGVLEYQAPEIFQNNQYDEKVDVWSAGIVLYTILAGQEPFRAKTIAELISKITTTEPDYKSIDASLKCISFLKSVLQKDPKQRPSAAQALNHSWLQSKRYKELLSSDRSISDNGSFDESQSSIIAMSPNIPKEINVEEYIKQEQRDNLSNRFNIQHFEKDGAPRKRASTIKTIFQMDVKPCLEEQNQTSQAKINSFGIPRNKSVHQFNIQDQYWQ